MSPSFALLGLLSRKPSYGYDLKRHYDLLLGGERSLPFGQVYACLARLLKEKKITVETVEKDKGPERKRYRLTNVGRRELEAWLKQAESTPKDTQSVLLIKVATAFLLNESPHSYLDMQRHAYLQQMRILTEKRRTKDTVGKLQIDYSLLHLEANLRWIDMTTARLEALKKEVEYVG